MSETARLAEAQRFDTQKLENIQKMKEFTQMLHDNPKDMSLKNIDEEGVTQENEDDFDDYFEKSLMQEADSMGIFE